MENVEKDIRWTIDGKCLVDVRTAGEVPVKVELVKEDGTTVLLSFAPYNARYRGKVDGVEIRAESKKPFGASCVVRSLQASEPVDFEDPPAPPTVNNFLQMVRAKVRREMGVTREAFDNDTGFPGYELRDDEDPLFEEELAASRQKSSPDNVAKRPEPLPDGEVAAGDPPPSDKQEAGQ